MSKRRVVVLDVNRYYTFFLCIPVKAVLLEHKSKLIPLWSSCDFNKSDRGIGSETGSPIDEGKYCTKFSVKN